MNRSTKTHRKVKFSSANCRGAGLQQIMMPPAVPLRALPPTHPAMNYLRERGYNPSSIADSWDIYYSHGNSVVQPFFPDARLVVPLHSVELVSPCKKDARFKGWQARSIEEDTKGRLPKYLFCRGMQRNLCLYNMQMEMNGDGPLFLVKGVTDAWRLATHVVALLGWTISPTQAYYITRDFKRRPVVVFLDRDHEKAAQLVARVIRFFREQEHDPTPVVVGHVPEHRKDIADCTPEEALGAACSALAQFNDRRLMGIFR